MRYGNSHSHIRGLELLPLDHCVDIAQRDAATVNEHLSSAPDGLLLRFGRQSRAYVPRLKHPAEPFQKSVQTAVLEEVFDYKQFRGRLSVSILANILQCPIRKHFLADHDIRIGRNIVNRAVADIDIQSGILNSLAEAGGSQSAGAHSGIAAEDYL